MKTLRYRFFLLGLVAGVALVGASLSGVLAQSATPTAGTKSTPTLRRAGATTTNNWLQFDGNAQHSGDSPQETTLSSANVASLAQVFQVALPAIADGAPAYLSQVVTATGTRNLLFVTTKAGDIVALDATTGAQVWIHSYPAGSCLINNAGPACYTTASPAIDPTLQYVYSYGLDGNIHKLAVGTGTEVIGGGWPELVTLKGFDEKGSSDLSIVTAKSGVSYLYVTSSGYPGDGGDYQGHVTAIDLASGVQTVFNANCSVQPVHFVETPSTPDCSAKQSAIWARPGTIYDATTDRILLATGNGPFSATASSTSYDWGDSVFSLAPTGVSANGLPLDSYTPTNYQALNAGDLDLGSTAPAIIPIPANTSIPRLAVQSGKDAMLRLLNLDNLSGQGGPGHVGGELALTAVPQGGEVLTQPATWVNPADGSSWVFVASASGISALQLQVSVVNGVNTPSLVAMWSHAEASDTSPLIANNVLYDATGGAVRALSPTTGTQLWQGTIGGIHWESPIVVNGVLYVTDENGNLTAFAPPAPAPTPTPTPSTPAPTPTSTSATAHSIVLPFVANGNAPGS